LTGPERAIGGGSLLRARSDLASAEIDDEIVLYDDAEQRLHRLNSSAATLWRCLDGGATLEQIAADVAEVYGIAKEDAMAGLIDLARQLWAEGLVEALGE
jgi:hypothetical protein